MRRVVAGPVVVVPCVGPSRATPRRARRWSRRARPHDRRVEHGRERAARARRAGRVVELVDIRHAAAHDEHVRIEGVDDDREAARDAVDVARPDESPASRSPAAHPLDDLRRRRSPARRGRRSACWRKSRAKARPRDPASPCSRAGRSSRAAPGISVTSGRGSGLWPHSPRAVVRPVVRPPADGDPRPRAGAEDHARRRRCGRRRRRRPPRRRRSSRRRSPPGPRARGPRAGRASTGRPFSQVELAPLAMPGPRVERARQPDPDRAARARSRPRCAHQLADRAMQAA